MAERTPGGQTHPAPPRILVASAAPVRARRGRPLPMAVVVKINPGFDASYPWREIGTGDGAAASPLDYYLAPADRGGEPLGCWAGRGLGVLGFAEGEVIDRAVFEPLFGQYADPRDPSGSARLGRAPQRFASDDDIYRELVAAEPHASEARRSELRTLARAQARHAVPFWDVTLSVSKSITLFHGGLLARAEQARQEGNAAEARHYERQAARVWEAIMAGNAARRFPGGGSLDRSASTPPAFGGAPRCCCHARTRRPAAGRTGQISATSMGRVKDLPRAPPHYGGRAW
jgi:hypothetical protein